MENKIQEESKSVKLDSPILTFTTTKELNSWLAKHNASSTGIWVRLFKKKSDVTTITYSEALDVALCYGWIDGQKNHTIRNHGFRNSHPEDQKAFGLREIGSILNDLKNQGK